MTLNHPLQFSVGLVLLGLPMIVSRLGFGTRLFWTDYVKLVGGFFLVFAVAGWLVVMGMALVGHEAAVVDSITGFAMGSLGFAVCAALGGSSAEKTAGRMRRV